MPIPVRPKPFLSPGCPGDIYAGLALLSQGCTPDGGRLHTCYSPVRHSPAGGASSSPAAVRLACVKPAASVHPEPGSNSPLLVIYLYIYLQCCVRPAFHYLKDGISLTETPSKTRVPLSLLRPAGRPALLVLWHHVIVLNLSAPGPRLAPRSLPSVCFPIADAKLQHFSALRKFSRDFFMLYSIFSP